MSWCSLTRSARTARAYEVSEMKAMMDLIGLGVDPCARRCVDVAPDENQAPEKQTMERWHPGCNWTPRTIPP